MDHNELVSHILLVVIQRVATIRVGVVPLFSKRRA